MVSSVKVILFILFTMFVRLMWKQGRLVILKLKLVC